MLKKIQINSFLLMLLVSILIVVAAVSGCHKSAVQNLEDGGPTSDGDTDADNDSDTDTDNDSDTDTDNDSDTDADNDSDTDTDTDTDSDTDSDTDTDSDADGDSDTDSDTSDDTEIDINTDVDTDTGGEGGKLIWAVRAGGTGSELGSKIATLPDGSSIVTGQLTDISTFGPGDANETVLSPTTDNDIFIALYNNDGTLAWAKMAIGVKSSFTSHFFSAFPLLDGTFLVTGAFGESATFSPGEPEEITLTAIDNDSEAWNHVFLAKYSGDGVVLWAKTVTSPVYLKGSSVQADDSTVLIGNFMNSATFGLGDPNETTLTTMLSMESDIFVAKINSNGQLAWAKSAGCRGNCANNGIAALPDGAVVVTGAYGDTVTFGLGEPGETVLNIIDDSDYDDSDIFVAKYNSDGTLAWVKSAGQYGYDTGLGVTGLSDGSAVVTGLMEGWTIFGIGEPNETEFMEGINHSTIFVAKYNPDGTLAWAKDIIGHRNNAIRGITAMPDNTVQITGYYQKVISFGVGEPNEISFFTTGITGGFFLARYAADGTVSWARSGVGEAMSGKGVAALPDNSSIVTGGFWVNATFGYGQPGETTLTSAGDADIFIAKFAP